MRKPNAMATKKKPAKKSKKKSAPVNFRLWARVAAGTLALLLLVLCIAGDLYVHHPVEWLVAHESPFTAPLELIGDPLAFVTDGLGWTGRDAVNTPDDDAPVGMVHFAGAPVRTGAPCPSDVTVLDRGEFQVGWSPSLQHPVWVAYHVPRAAAHPATRRPNYQRDRSVSSAPSPDAYKGTGYDRGHMAPNYAITTRFGADAQKRTFQMTNIAPQLPSLNRGPWRELEHRIAELWTARYGEIWVIVGCYTPTDAPAARSRLGNTSVDVPENFYMVVAAQTEDSVRVLAVDLGQPRARWRAEGRRLARWRWPAHAIVSVDELERRTGLDFFPDMQKSLQMSLEADLPTRLWPVRFIDLFKLILLRFV